MPPLWQRITGPFREFGVGAGALYLVDRLLRRVSPRLGLYAYEFLAQPISAGPLLPANKTNSLSFQDIDENHPDTKRMPVRPDIVAARFAQGAHCLGAYRKGEFIGYMWWCSSVYEEDEVRCTYSLADRDHAVFDFDFYVFPEYRMGIAFLAVWHGANEMLHARGVTCTFSRMTRFNLASRRAHTRLGARCIGRALFVQVANLQAMLSDLRPYISVSLAPETRPCLHIDARIS